MAGPVHLNLLAFFCFLTASVDLTSGNHDFCDYIRPYHPAYWRFNIRQLTDCFDRVVQASKRNPFEGLVFVAENTILAFRATAGIHQPAFERFIQNGSNDDTHLARSGLHCGCLTPNGSLPCQTHYRSRILDEWPSKLIDTVRLTLFENGEARRFLEFDGTGSTFLSWFSRDRLVDTDWTDLNEGEATAFFTIFGALNRRFFIDRNDGGCVDEEAGWLIVADGPDVCPFVPEDGPFPVFLYSRATNATIWSSDTTAQADVFTVTVKLQEDAVFDGKCIP